MKIYAYFPEWTDNVVSKWTEHITDQIKETVGLIYEECNNDPKAWRYAGDERPLFPFFYQEDTHARFILRDENVHDRYFINGSYYVLMFQWEVSDFDEGLEDDYKEYYDKLLKEVGLNSEADIVIPDAFVYLGSYYYGQSDPLELPGLVFNNDDFDENDSVLADCMYKNKKAKEN